MRVVLLATEPSGQHWGGTGRVVDLLSQAFFALVEEDQKYDQDRRDRTKREIDEGRQELVGRRGGRLAFTCVYKLTG